MAETSEKSFPFDAESVEGVYDRTYLAEDFARYFRAFISSGVFMDESTNLQIIANGDMTVTLKPGNIIIDGYRYENESDIVIQIDPADGVLSRIDRISVTWSKADRDIHYTVQQGTKSYNPTAPEARRTSDYKDYVVADISVNAGAISISQSDITDQRLNTELCGIAAAFCKIDTTSVFNQFMDWFQQIKTNGEKNVNQLIQSFTDWMNALEKSEEKEVNDLVSSYDQWITDLESDQKQQCEDLLGEMKDLLSGDAAGKLQVEIDELRQAILECEEVTRVAAEDGSFLETEDGYLIAVG